jgi:hypothetical protein
VGEEISTSHFSQQDFIDYGVRLARETALLKECFAGNRFSADAPLGGFELEAWLIDANACPAPVNDTFLERLGNPLVVPELAQFNIEINTTPRLLAGNSLRNMHADLARTWKHCREVAQTLDVEPLMIGILPTLCESELTLANMSAQVRYRALNEQVFQLRRNRPITLDIKGHDHLHTTHRDVMLEAAATSFQVHLQLSQAQSVRFYNAAMILSAPIIAACANSPYLFGRDLWDETRILLFEQAVGVLPSEKASRASFGSGYVRTSLMECFDENRDTCAVLLPILIDEPVEKFSHLCLHNGTIWRWNRPLIGFSADGTPHLRLEHRIIPAGPSIIDTIANAALFFGLVQALGTTSVAPESLLTFKQARSNFYIAAQHGLRAEVVWLAGERIKVSQLLLNILLPLARQGLKALMLSPADIALYLGIIEARLRSGRNGATWQRAFVAKYGKDMRQLTRAYREHQHSGAPVHEWPL